MRQLAVISGKGGTGKTSLLASFAALAGETVTADCDVDAADLHLVLSPQIKNKSNFQGGFLASIDADRCLQCEQCRDLCRFDAISEDFEVDPFSCEGCGVCADNCPIQCVDMSRETAGQWFISETRFGPMVHARLGIAQENSGKLVALVRDQAKKVASSQGINLVLIDGSPGIGCPVISSITGVDFVLVVTEPTLSGMHDLRRVLRLTRHFKLPAGICVNKFDLNTEITSQMEKAAIEFDAPVLGYIPFDHNITQAMVAKKTLPEYSTSAATKAVADLWNKLSGRLVEKSCCESSPQR